MDRYKILIGFSLHVTYCSLGHYSNCICTSTISWLVHLKEMPIELQHSWTNVILLDMSSLFVSIGNCIYVCTYAHILACKYINSSQWNEVISVGRAGNSKWAAESSGNVLLQMLLTAVKNHQVIEVYHYHHRQNSPSQWHILTWCDFFLALSYKLLEV